MPTIGLVTLSFNQGIFLPTCVDSIQGQLAYGDEYVVVDAGSSDGSRPWLQSNARPPTRLDLRPDEGPADGLRRGLQSLSTDILGFVNSDDCLLPQTLTSVRQYFVHHPTVDVASAHALRLNEQTGRTGLMVSSSYSPLRAASGVHSLVQPSTFFRRSAYARTAGINASNRTCWDAELWLDLLLSGASFRVVNEIWAIFRLHAASITGSGISRRAFEQEYNRVLAERSLRRRAVLREAVRCGEVLERVVRSGAVLRSGAAG